MLLARFIERLRPRLSNHFFDLRVGKFLTCFSAGDDLLLNLVRRRRRSKEIEASQLQIQIPNHWGFPVQLVDIHVVESGALAVPIELSLEPRQPAAVLESTFALGQSSADFDHVADHTLAERPDYRGMFS